MLNCPNSEKFQPIFSCIQKALDPSNWISTELLFFKFSFYSFGWVFLYQNYIKTISYWKIMSCNYIKTFHNNIRIYLKSDNHVGYRLKLLNAFLSKLDNRSKFWDERFFIRKKLTNFKQIQINFFYRTIR